MSRTMSDILVRLPLAKAQALVQDQCYSSLMCFGLRARHLDLCSVALRSLAAGPRDERGGGPPSIGIDCEADC